MRAWSGKFSDSPAENLFKEMRFYKDLYVGEAARVKLNKIKKNIRTGKLQPGVYVISPAVSENDLLDIIPSYMLHASRYRETEILGIAVTKEEALELCAQMITDVYSKTGTFDIKAFFK